jgi:beta-glucanase (GH16 family)
MNISPLYRLAWPLGQRAIKVSEALIHAPMTAWHTYQLEWHKTTARFSVDGQVIHACTTPPRGPLGFVMWFDNQYMVVTPWGRFASGLLGSGDTQWMEVSALSII